MFISKMKLLNNEARMGYETDDNYLLNCCKYFEMFAVAEVSRYSTTLKSNNTKCTYLRTSDKTNICHCLIPMISINTAPNLLHHYSSSLSKIEITKVHLFLVMTTTFNLFLHFSAFILSTLLHFKHICSVYSTS